MVDGGSLPSLMLSGYANGIFPMSESRDDPELFWVEPRMRGVFPVGGFHASRSLRKRLRRGEYNIRVNHDFGATVDACADRPETWINDELHAAYRLLHARGWAHSLEVWHADSLIGGVYGIGIGRAFFGESMFSRATDASKIALAYLHARLQDAGFVLFDTQFLTDHLASLGAVEIPRAEYERRLEDAIRPPTALFTAPETPSPDQLVQRMTQTS